MAADWIKMRVDLFTHPKVVRISSALKADALRTVGGLMSVWCLFDAHSVDGRIEGYTPETLDDMLRWPGFAEQMIAVAWLEQDGEALVLPRFDRHNGTSAKRRAQDASRKRAVRKTSALQADKMRTREEKRREEEKKENDAPDGASPAPPKKPKGGITLAAYLAECEAAGVKAIPEDDAVFAYAERVGLPVEFLALAWQWFRAKYGPDGTGRAKRYTDWRATFRNAVKDGWPKFWAIDQSGAYYLTTAGKQAQREYGDAG